MDIKKSDRGALKSYFAKNAVPTAGNFADLIDGMLNQKEDGIAKVAGEPLSVQADSASIQKVLNFYRDFADAKPAWTLSLNPLANPKDPKSAKPGWSVGDSDGNSKLFIDQSTGNVGIGTAMPGQRLHVQGGNGVINNAFLGDVGHGNDWAGFSHSAVPTRTSYGFLHHKNGQHALINKKSGAGHIGFRINNADKMVLLDNGNVGIGTGSPKQKLHIGGGNLQLDSGKEIFFTDNGQIRSADNNHRILFRRTVNKMELREYGDILFSPGATGGAETAKITFKANGNVGIGSKSPTAKLEVDGTVTATSTNNAVKVPGSNLKSSGTIAIKSNAPQIDFIDTEHKDWAIHVNSNRMYFIREPWNYSDLVLDGAGSVGIGTHTPAAKLQVVGPVMEQLDVIKCRNRGDWTAANHPIMSYFRSKLKGKPVGTYLKAIQDHPSWRGHYWQGWVDVDKNIRVIHNYHNSKHFTR